MVQLGNGDIPTATSPLTGAELLFLDQSAVSAEATVYEVTKLTLPMATAYGATEVRSDNEVPIAACLAAHGSCFVPAGTWPCSDEVLLADDEVLYGAGRLKTILKHSTAGHHGAATAAFDTQTGSDEYALADVVSGAEIRDLMIEGPDIAGSEPPVAGTDHGIALYGRRLTIENVDVRFWPGHGIICELGTEGGIEYDIDHQSNLNNVFVRRCGLTGITWRTPDAYLDNIFVSYVRGHGVHMDDTGNYNGSADGGFWHIYSTGYGTDGLGDAGAGVRADGRLQIHQLQLDGCFGSSLESVSADCQFGQVYAFLGHRNDSGGAAAGDVHIDLQAQCQIGLLKVKTQEGGTAVKASNTRIQIDQMELDGTKAGDGVSTGIGLHLTTAAQYCKMPNIRVFGYSDAGGVGVQLDGTNHFCQLAGTVTDCDTGLTDAGGSDDTRLDFQCVASSGQTSHTYVWTGDRRRDVIIPSGAGTLGVAVRGDHSETWQVGEYVGNFGINTQPYAWGMSDSNAFTHDGFVCPGDCQLKVVAQRFTTVGGAADSSWEVYKNGAGTGDTWTTGVGANEHIETFTTPIEFAAGDRIDLRCTGTTNTTTDGRVTLAIGI